MLRWLVRSTVAGSANSDVRSESDRASRKANEAKRQFDYAKRERDPDKKMTYLVEGMSYLAESVNHVSNTTVPLAKVAFAASLLVENVQDNLDEQTKDIVRQLKNVEKTLWLQKINIYWKIFQKSKKLKSQPCVEAFFLLNLMDLRAYLNWICQQISDV